MRTYVYVDGFNLYYGSLRNTPYKWLDLAKLCSHLLKPNDILKIKYFTARVVPRKNDPQQALRQQMYLRALQTTPEIEIYFGHFLSHPVTMAECNQHGETTGAFRRVLKTEEKGSDVNLASHLLLDAFKDSFDVAVLITNDSDLLTPMRIAKEEFGKVIGLINPQARASRELAKHATFVKQIRSGVLAKSQYPDALSDRNGSFHKPKAW